VAGRGKKVGLDGCTALAGTSDDRQIACLIAALQALAQAQAVPEVKKILDLAAAAEVYATRQRLSDELIGAAHRLKIAAMIKLGELWLTSPKANGGDAQRTRFGIGTESPLTLEAQGIDKKLAMVSQQVARLPAALQERIANREITIARAILEHRRATASRPPLPKGQFRVILADAAWDYGSGARSGNDHYPTMSIAEIAAMDVRSLAADNAVLFFWVTAPLLFACEPIIKSWGFVYKENIVWDKVRGITGSYINVCHEHLLICTRGCCLPDRLTPALDSVQTIPRSDVHSQKPDQFYEMIERLYDGPYLELFARRPRAGWSSFGNDPALNEVVATSNTLSRAVSQAAGAGDPCAR
jgi:N6-adenosine-specific RNA methylase IME4